VSNTGDIGKKSHLPSTKKRTVASVGGMRDDQTVRETHFGLVHKVNRPPSPARKFLDAMFAEINALYLKRRAEQPNLAPLGSFADDIEADDGIESWTDEQLIEAADREVYSHLHRQGLSAWKSPLSQSDRIVCIRGIRQTRASKFPTNHP